MELEAHALVWVHASLDEGNPHKASDKDSLANSRSGRLQGGCLPHRVPRDASATCKGAAEQQGHLHASAMHGGIPSP